LGRSTAQRPAAFNARDWLNTPTCKQTRGRGDMTGLKLHGYTGASHESFRRKEMTSSASRRRFLVAASATSAMLSTGIPLTARAQGSIALRISSSLTADQNSAHYIWYQRFASNLKSAAGSRIATDFFPNSQLGKEADVVQQVKVGSIDVMLTGSSIWATV